MQEILMSLAKSVSRALTANNVFTYSLFLIPRVSIFLTQHIKLGYLVHHLHLVSD